MEKKTFGLMVEIIKAADKKVIRKKGNYRGRPISLIVEDQLLLMLMYYREYRTQFHIGHIYGISESAVCRTIERVENILSKVKELQLPGKNVMAGRQQEFSVVVINATEMPIERPKKSNSSTTAAKRNGIC